MQHDLTHEAESRSAQARRLRAAHLSGLVRPLALVRPEQGALPVGHVAGHVAVSLGAGELDASLPDRGLALGALHECVPAGHGDFAAALGFSLALAARVVSKCAADARPGGVLWVFPTHCGFEQGRLHAPGLMAFGLDPARFIEVGVQKTRAMLWVMEEGLSTGALAAVIGVETGRDYDFTASRRLAMRAERSGVTALLIRACKQADGSGGASTAATTRWRIATEPHAHQLGAAGPRIGQGHENPGVGAPRWAVSLIKSKRGMPGHRQVVEWDHETLSFRMAAALAGRTPVSQNRRGTGEQAGSRKWAAAS
ncbi:MAG: inducible mutagenesis protein A [Nitratireductor sp.]|nr:inducible mutagenesis protein A [Nitratireductor sp.]